MRTFTILLFLLFAIACSPITEPAADSGNVAPDSVVPSPTSMVVQNSPLGEISPTTTPVSAKTATLIAPKPTAVPPAATLKPAPPTAKPATPTIQNVAALPAKAMLNLTHEYQKWNNCGPVSLGVVATYFGIARDQ